MSWLTSVADFILSEWLWNVTWGWHHIPVNIFMMLFLLKFFADMRIMPSVLISVFSQLFSFLALSFLAIIWPMYTLGMKFVPYDCYTHTITHPLIVGLSLGGIYFVLNLVFFSILHAFYTFNLRLVFLIALVSNILSALLVYRFWGCHFLV